MHDEQTGAGSVAEAEGGPNTGPTSLADVVPRSLRGVGACLLVAAASSFMFHDWGEHDDVTRYLLLVGQLVLLAGAGFFCALAVREKRGARTFLSLVLAVVPVHFAVLGGVLYSQLALDTPATDLPTYAVWRAPDAWTAVLLALGAQIALVPATFVAMLTLVRRHAWRLTFAFAALNAVLLVPVRDPDVIAAVTACVVPLSLLLQVRVLAGTPSYSTPQGRFVRTMLAVPYLLLIGRTLLHYSATVPFAGVTALALGLALFVYTARLGRDGSSAALSVPQAAGTLTMLAGWGAVAGDAASSLPAGAHGYVLPLFMLPWALAFVLLSAGAVRGKRWYRRLGAVVAAGCVCPNALLFPDLSTALLCLGVGLVLLFAGTAAKQKLPLILGGIAVATGVVLTAVVTLDVEALTHWASLTAIGVVLIFAASALERMRHVLLDHLAELRASFRKWGY